MNLMLAVAGMLAALAIPASAQQNPLFGTWEIVGAQPAPWVDEDKHAPLKAAGQRMINQTVSFAAAACDLAASAELIWLTNACAAAFLAA